MSISVRGLTKRYDGRAVLSGVDLEVRGGSVHALLGPNGAGKTTLLRAVLALLRPDGGDVEVRGTAGGFVDRPGAYPYFTARENLQLLAALDEDPADVDEVLARVGLAGAEGKVGGWSLGMRQRLGIAAGLLRRPQVLVLDEPANGLDPAGTRELRSLLRELAAAGVAVLVSSHDLPEVDAVADDVTVLLSGEVRWHGTVEELRSRPGAHLLTTSDDPRAAALLGARLAPDGRIEVHGSSEEVDAVVLSLAAQGIAVRELVRERVPLEQAFLDLTEVPS